MKVLKNSILVTFTVLFLSCTTDDVSPIDTNADANNLEGTWDLIEETQNGTVSGEFGGIPVNGNITSVGKDFNTELEFSQNPDNFMASGNYTDVIKISAATITLFEGEFVVPINDFISQGAWSLSQGILTLTQNNVAQNVRITELTTTTLKIEFDIENQEVTYDGNTGTVNSTIKMTFAKQ